MANFNCVEPAQQNATDKTFVTATAGDQITFPAVDSCFAVCLVLADGSMVGGHTPALWDDKSFGLELSKFMLATRTGGTYNPETGGMPLALGKIMEGLHTLRNKRTVVLAITLGDKDWDAFWAEHMGGIGYPKQIRYRKPSGQRNLIVDAVGQAITVQARAGALYANVGAAARAFNQGTINALPVPC